MMFLYHKDIETKNRKVTYMGHHFFSSGWMSQLMGGGQRGPSMLGGFSLFRTIGILLFLFLIYYVFIKKRKESVQPNNIEETALEILQKEFARGNISEDEFLIKKSYLGFPENRSKKNRRN